jgi:hypothetical protein
LIGETVTRLRYATTGTDRYGNAVRDPDDEAPAELPIAGAMFDPGGSVEPVERGREAVITQPTAYFVGQWPDILASDQLRIRGRVYEVIGDPGDWRSGFGTSLGGLVVPLKRVDG